MKTNKYNRYSYAELREKALSANAKQIDINTLGAWLSEYGNCWNGEYYDADEGLRIFPVYEQDGEDFTIIGYDFR